MQYPTRSFNIPTLEGISEESVRQHLSLYDGYVKNFNTIESKLVEYATDADKNSYAISELIRRKSFEFDGMKLHELYFAQFEGGRVSLNTHGGLATALNATYGEYFETHFKTVAMMRGPGWAILYYDPEIRKFHAGFVGEQHQGHFATLPVVLALDVWEHAFLLDHTATGKVAYVDAFFNNLNWEVVEERFARITH